MFQPFISHEQEEFPLPPAKVWTIRDLNKTGLMDYDALSDVHLHFIRGTTRKIVQYLNDQYNCFLFSDHRDPLHAAELFGGSGDGKSTETFGWFHNIDADRVWIHNDTQEGKHCYITRIFWNPAGNPAGWIWESTEVNSIDQVLFILNDPAHRWIVAVFDGYYCKDDLNSLFQVCFRRKIFGVKCIPHQSGHLNASLHCLFEFGESFTVTGFTKAEYISAEQVLHYERTRDEILEMYYYAGGSARYYFQYFGRIRSLCNFLLRNTSRFPHSANSLQGVAGLAMADAVSSIIVYLDPNFGSSPTIVSKYVTRLLSDKVSRNFVYSVKNALLDNASWQGWCTELDFYSIVRSQISHGLNLVLKIKRERNNPEQDIVVFNHRVKRVIRFDSLEQLNPAALTGSTSADQILFVPIQYYNRGYDAIFIRYRQIAKGRVCVSVDIFQITHAHSHSKKLESTGQFLQRLFPDGHPFAEFSILYRIVTPYRNDFSLNLECRSGIFEITNTWDTQFSWPDSFSVVYFDENIDK